MSIATTEPSTSTTAAEEDVEAQTKPVEMSRMQKLVLQTIFVITGNSELFFWNCVLNILYDIRANVYADHPSMTDTLTAVNNICSLIIAVYTVKTGAMNQIVIMASGFGMAVLSLLFAATVQWAPGTTGVVLLHVICGLSGVCSGFYQTGGFGLASVMPIPMTGYVSTGNGVCGVLTWIIWFIITKAGMGTKSALWVLMGIGFGVLVLACAAYIYLLRKPDIHEKVNFVQKALKEEASNPEAPSYRFLFLQTWKLIVTIWLCMTTTLFIFPNIGPLGWPDGTFTNWVLGTFQFGDLIGRYSPNIAPFLMMDISALLWSNVARTIILIPISISIWKVPLNKGLANKGFHVVVMAVISLTNGCWVSNVFINTPKAIRQEAWRSRVSSMVVLFLLFGIACGLWIGRLVTWLGN